VLSLRYRLGERWEELLARFELLGRRAAIVGPHGSGKTTLLEDLAPRLREAGFTPRPLRLDAESPRFEPGLLDAFFATLGAGDVILFDGAEQLGAVAWHRFERRSRAAAGLLLTTHHPGRLPTLIETSTTPELLETLVAQILGDAAPLRPQMPALFERHRGNLRDALRELYDRYAAVEE
jgi:hypothetical protein